MAGRFPPIGTHNIIITTCLDPLQIELRQVFSLIDSDNNEIKGTLYNITLINTKLKSKNNRKYAFSPPPTWVVCFHQVLEDCGIILIQNLISCDSYTENTQVINFNHHTITEKRQSRWQSLLAVKINETLSINAFNAVT